MLVRLSAYSLVNMSAQVHCVLVYLAQPRSKRTDNSPVHFYFRLLVGIREPAKLFSGADNQTNIELLYNYLSHYIFNEIIYHIKVCECLFVYFCAKSTFFCFLTSNVAGDCSSVRELPKSMSTLVFEHKFTISLCFIFFKYVWMIYI